MAVRRDRAIPAPMRIEMLGADQMRRKRVRNIHEKWLVGANCHRSHKGPWIASFRLPGTFRTELAGRGFQACQHMERTTQTKGRLVARTSAATLRVAEDRGNNEPATSPSIRRPRWSAPQQGKIPSPAGPP